MKQFSILFLLVSFLLSTGVWSFADSKIQESNLNTVKSKKKKGKKEVKPAPKKTRKQQKDLVEINTSSTRTKTIKATSSVYQKNKRV